MNIRDVADSNGNVRNAVGRGVRDLARAAWKKGREQGLSRQVDVPQLCGDIAQRCPNRR